MATEYFYPGAKYALEPEYNDILPGYKISASDISLATDPRTANQIQEVSKKLNAGVKNIEISQVRPDVFESIPQQHFNELRRLGKLTGVQFSLHAPIVEPSGFDQEGKWSEVQREMAEKQMTNAVARAHEVNPEANIPVTFHASAVLPEGLMRIKEGEGAESIKRMVVVDPQTGGIREIRESKKYFPGEEKIFDPEKERQRFNETIWTNELNQLTLYTNRGEELIEHTKNLLTGGKEQISQEEVEKFEKKLLEMYRMGKAMSDEELEKFKEEGLELEKSTIETVKRELGHAQVFLMDSYNHLRELYNRVYHGTLEASKKGNGKAKEDLEKLNKLSQEIRDKIEKEKVASDPSKLTEFVSIVEKGINVLKDIKPEIYKPINDFVIDKSSETFANVALEAFLDKNIGNKNPDKTPIISIENPPAGAALSRVEELKKLIEESRRKFVEKAKERGISKSEAEKAAEKIIGATWDVGHINMLRKYGYTSEEIEEQTRKIAKLVKHVHLSDNFGLEHTELPMGMGNVPIDKMLKELEKAGVSPKKIIEAGNWYEHFKTVPIRETLGELGAPIYAMRMPPYWSQIARLQQGYSAGYGTVFPEQHYSIYGGGFSQLPAELGGQVQQKTSRFSGTPME